MPNIAICFALTAAVLYTIGVLLLKRSTDWNPGPWRVTFICNVGAAFVFAPLWLMDGPDVDPRLLWQPAIIAVLFFGGQVLVVVSLTYGDVSVATPLLGMKILFVTALTILFRGDLGSETAPSLLWGAAALSTLGIGLLSSGGGSSHKRNVAFTVACSLAAAACYACFDVLVQRWGTTWTAARLMPLVMVFAAIISLALVPLFGESIRKIPKSAAPWILGGAFLTGLQSVFLTVSIATWAHAAETNVIYSTRGLWTVILVWLAGAWFSKEEQARGGDVLARRLIGATLLSLAVFLVI